MPSTTINQQALLVRASPVLPSTTFDIINALNPSRIGKKQFVQMKTKHMEQTCRICKDRKVKGKFSSQVINYSSRITIEWQGKEREILLHIHALPFLLLILLAFLVLALDAASRTVTGFWCTTHVIVGFALMTIALK
jgi:hypothetical protein